MTTRNFKAEHERRQKRIGSIDEFREAYSELSFIIEGVEQPKRRPKQRQKRKSDYTGKKKRHTRKQLMAVTPYGIIMDQSPSVGGRVHDFRAFKRLRASMRVKIAHTISRRKKYRIAGEEYRNRDEGYDQTMNIVGGLVNLRAYERAFQRTGFRL